MRVSVDTSICQGHSLCHIKAPQAFDLHDVEGWSVVRFPDGLVPAELEPLVREAVATCPERAISLTD